METIPFSLAATIGGTLASVIAYQEYRCRGHDAEIKGLLRETLQAHERTANALEKVVERTGRP